MLRVNCNLLVLSSLSFSIVACNSRENDLMNKGNEIVVKVEAYKKQQGKFPYSLSDISVTESEAGPLYYNKRGDTGYIIWFGTTLGESKTYYSDSKKWEDFDR